MKQRELIRPMDRPEAAPASFREIATGRAVRLDQFGYAEWDAEFLSAVTVLGGFFVRRQYREWTGLAKGWAEREFLTKASGLGHVRACVRERLYRVSRESVYQELDSDHTVRGSTSRILAKRSLLALDYLTLRRDQSGWLVDAAQKSAYFQSLGVSEDRLPRGVRIRQGERCKFPGVIPIRTARGKPRMVEFLYPHAGSTAHHFKRQLKLYEPLATGLRSIGIGCCWRVLTEDQVQLLRLRNAWGKWVTSHKPDPTELEYFVLKKSFENERWAELSVADIDRYAELRRIHEDEGVSRQFRTTERRYRAWLERGSQPVEPGSDFAEDCELRELLLKHDYTLADRIRSGSMATATLQPDARGGPVSGRA